MRAMLKFYDELKENHNMLANKKQNPLRIFFTVYETYAHCGECRKWKIDVVTNSTSARAKLADERNGSRPNHHCNRPIEALDSSTAPSKPDPGVPMHLCSKCGDICNNESGNRVIYVRQASCCCEQLGETVSILSDHPGPSISRHTLEEVESLVESLPQVMDQLAGNIDAINRGVMSPSPEAPVVQSTGADRASADQASTQHWRLVFRPDPDATQATDGETGVQNETPLHYQVHGYLEATSPVDSLESTGSTMYLDVPAL